MSSRCPLLSGARLHRGHSHVYELSWSHADRYHAHGAVLIGDAAHTTNPTAGQGMTSALGDADALADLLGPALVLERTTADLDCALVAYEQRQRPVNARLVRQADALARFYAWRGPTGDLEKVFMARALGSRAGGWLGRALAGAFLTPRGAAPAPALPTRSERPAQQKVAA